MTTVLHFGYTESHGWWLVKKIFKTAEQNSQPQIKTAGQNSPSKIKTAGSWVPGRRFSLSLSLLLFISFSPLLFSSKGFDNGCDKKKASSST